MPMTVYNGKDNEEDIVLKVDDVPVTSDFVTRAEVAFLDKKGGSHLATLNSADDSSNFDLSQSQVVPGAGPSPIRFIRLLLGIGSPLPVGTGYYTEFIVYDATHANGRVWSTWITDVLQPKPAT